MEDRQLQTIRSILSTPIQREADVIHFVVEVRKLIEAMGKRFVVLRFFCDWALHHEMSWNAAKDILSIFDQYVGSLKNTDVMVVRQATKRLEPLISFERFRDDLVLLLYEYHLDVEPVRGLKTLIPMLNIYVDLVARSPLVVRDADSKLKYINNIGVCKVTGRIHVPGDPNGQFAFAVNWSLRKDRHEVASIVNEIWIPAVPIRSEQVLAKAINEGGKLKRIPLESKTFID